MESNFHLETHKKNQELHVHLHGVFDGSSAFQLIDVIREGSRQGLPVYIDTNHLKQAYPFGKAILDSHLPKNTLRAKVHFSGVWAKGIIPDGCVLFNGDGKKEGQCRGNCNRCDLFVSNTRPKHPVK